MSTPASPLPDASPAYPTQRQALRYWLHLGCVSFGGPAAQIGLMHQALVVEKRWISEARFLHALNYCMVLPGPEAQQLAIYIGWLLHGTRGGLVAGALFVLPAFLLLIALSWAYLQWGSLPVVAGFLYGIKPLVLALIVVAAHRLAKRVLKRHWLWSIALFALLLQMLAVPFPVLIAGAALVSWGLHWWQPARFAVVALHTNQGASKHLPSVIDDSTPSVMDVRPWQHGLQVLAIGLSLGVGGLSLLWLTFGTAHLYTQLAWFFTKAALLTFGGAYAVLPYVFDASVQQYHWLSTAQMLDGLALGESTPGPLIMVVTFIGFVAGWSQPLWLTMPAWCSGMIGATIVTWFTFLPSFILIFFGAPWIERSRKQLQLVAPLTGISAAVVGVIVHLALNLGLHVLKPQGWDQLALLMAGLALYLLIRRQCNVLILLFGFGALGALLHGFEMV